MKKSGKIGAIVMLIVLACVFVLGACDAGRSYYDKTKQKTYREGDAVFAIGDSNNGEDKESAFVDQLIKPTPNLRQQKYLDLEYYNFIHWGMNTFTDQEWGTGEEDPATFAPETVDTDQWARVLKASGSKGIIFTAKHHDGFCLWQTNTTEHSIKNSPYQNGQGDVVRQLAKSCRDYGLKFGIYLSPWDMNAPTYGKAAYNDFFAEQLSELMTLTYPDDPDTRIEVFSVWFDGAGNKDKWESGFQYDYDRFYQIVEDYQPDAVTCVSGRDVRWIGNEAGVSRTSEWSVINKGEQDPEKVAAESQQNPEMAEDLRKEKASYEMQDLGSRSMLSTYKDFDNLIFSPAEVDVSIRQGWFYHENQKPKSLQHLLQIYYKAVGGNSSLLLNVPPSSRGVIEQADAKVLAEFGKRIKTDKAGEVGYRVKVGNAQNIANAPYREELTPVLSQEGTWDQMTSYRMASDETILQFDLDSYVKVNLIDLREDLRFSQRVEFFDVYARMKNGKWRLLSNSTNVGNRRMVVIDPAKAVETDSIRIVVRQSRSCPVFRSIRLYA